ncbi:rhodanese-like domain-containing protein [Limisalsivibrio acetivorans]|uniref:rhodanese-like domain-containing protein n=1 Tax=Limisalsivibrio acetivorans TaxID=1304888 RepID=UPI0003B40A30|nr:rhodanese-like domain-containing protein [Limisalsivibrio acetivorans]
MRKYLFIILLITALPLSAAVKHGGEKGVVDTDYFRSIIGNTPDGVHLVDVRSESEFDTWHVPGAMQINVYVLYDGSCEEFLSKLPADGEVIFYCTSGGQAADAYYGLLDTCGLSEEKMKRFYFLDALLDCSGEKCTVKDIEY